MSRLILFTAAALLGLLVTVNAHHALVLTETGNNRHAVIDNAWNALNAEMVARGWEMTRTDQSDGFFTPASLAGYDVVVFLITSGDGSTGVLEGPGEKDAFEAFIQGGGGFVGIHSAAGTYETSWPWFEDMVGAGFGGHPAGVQTGTIRIEDRSHTSVSHLPDRWEITDEIFNFNYNYSPMRQTVQVLATVDESTISQGNSLDHPIVWCHEYDGGRAWYSGLGHTDAMWLNNPDHVKMVADGLEWVEGENAGDPNAGQDSSYLKTTIFTPTPGAPVIAIATTPDDNDERVFFIERNTGNVDMYRPSNGETVVIQTIPVFSGLEDGLMGIAFDPNFISNQYVYFCYSPQGISENRISRFTMSGDTFALASEVVVLSIPTQRDQCCHSGGNLNFGSDGNLWLTVGDNTNPFSSQGYTPIDERPGRGPWDAQKSSSNTNDLRGKILRITVQPDGSYVCPPDNLFTQDATHRCEIYTMGNRNPYRMAVNPYDPTTIYWGEVGPDGGKNNNNRGPPGGDEVNKAAAAGNYGWPYCLANNQPYVDYDFDTKVSGATFNCNAPTNDSPNSNGATSLPPAQPAMVWYQRNGFKSDVEAVPDGGGYTALAPYMHKHDPLRTGACALPKYFDNSLFFAEWSRNALRQYIMDSNGDLLHAIKLWDSFEFLHPMDMTVANDGSLYVVEYGLNFSGENARVSRMCYTANTAAISCSASGAPQYGSVPLTVFFDGSSSVHSEGKPLSFEWDFDGDQMVDSTDPSPQFTYTSNGNQVATLRVYETTNPSVEASCTVAIAAGNNFPEITILQPPLKGGLVNWGDEVVHEVTVFDVEDGFTPLVHGIDCGLITLEASLGHEDHVHGYTSATGCISVSPIMEEADTNEYLDWEFWVVSGTYTDQGAPGVLPSTQSVPMQLHGRMRQAEKYSAASNVICEANSQLARFEAVAGCSEGTTDAGGGLNVESIVDGSWLRFDNYNPHNVDSVTFRVASGNVGTEVGIVEMRLDDPITGTLLAQASVPGTGGWQTWLDVNVPLQEPNQLFDIDLGSEYSVTAITLDSLGSPDDYPRGYQVYMGGNDGSFGSPIQPVHRNDRNLNTSAVQDIVLCSQEDAVRYVRIMQMGDDNLRPWSIHEVQVFDENSDPISIQSVSASREANGDVAANAIDGDPDTRWSTGEVQNGGPYDLYIVASVGADGPTSNTASLYNLNWFRFDGGQGVSRPQGGSSFTESCSGGGGEQCLVDADCSDGLGCNGVETCEAGRCRPGPPIPCNNGDTCTIDSCIEPGICEYSPISCDDGNPCTDDTCDPVGGCLNTNNDDLTCDNGVACDGVEMCQAGACVGTEPVNCDDSNVCTNDICLEPSGTCQNTYQENTGGSALAFAVNCGGGEVMVDGYTYLPDDHFLYGATYTGAGPMVPPTAPGELYLTERWGSGALAYEFPVDAGKEYHITMKFAEAWDGITGPGQRVFDILVEGTTIAAAFDPYAMTGDLYMPYDVEYTYIANDSFLNIDFAGISQNPKVSAILIEETLPFCPGPCTTDEDCSNNNLCDGIEVCIDGACSQGTTLTCGMGDACTSADTCDPLSGCQAGMPITCDDGNPCTDDTCDLVDGCLSTPNDTLTCDNGAACDGVEMCQGGACVSGTPMVCDDMDECTTDSCSEPGTCTFTPKTEEGDGDPILAYAVNCGAWESFTASDGYTYLPDLPPDDYFLNGATFTGPGPMEGTEDDALYLSERWASGKQVNYKFPVDAGKKYHITLKFAEVWDGITGPNQRKFNVKVEGTLLGTIDPYAMAGGPNKPYDIEYTYIAGDTELNIDVISKKKKQNAKIGAILVEEIPPLQCTPARNLLQNLRH